MANVNSLLLGNLQANNQNRLILDSNAIMEKFRDVLRNHVNRGEGGDDGRRYAIDEEIITTQLSQGDTKMSKTTKFTDATEIEPVLKDVLENKYKLFDDPFFRSFNFTNRKGSLNDMSYRRDADESVTGNQRPSAFTFDLNAELEPDTEPINTDLFQLEDGDIISIDRNTNLVKVRNYDFVIIKK